MKNIEAVLESLQPHAAIKAASKAKSKARPGSF